MFKDGRYLFDSEVFPDFFHSDVSELISESKDNKDELLPCVYMSFHRNRIQPRPKQGSISR
jgi:hypothetical protein